MKKNYSISLVKITCAFLSILGFTSYSADAQSNTPCGAPALTVNTSGTCVTTNGTTVGATYQSNAANGGTPSCASPGAPDVWYSFVAPAGGSVIISSSAGTITDSGMGLYSGACTAPVAMACNDDAIGTMSQITQTGLTPGATYYIRFWKYNAGTGTFGICITTPPPPPANDNACGAISLTAASGTTCSPTSATTAGATQSLAGCLGTADDDVWFSFTAVSTTQSITVTPGASFDPVVQVFSGTACGSLTSINCNDANYPYGATGSNTVSGLTVGSTYWVRVYDYSSGASSTPTFSICVTTPPPPGPGSACSTANAFCTGTTYTFPNSTNQASLGAIDCLSSTPNPVWYFMQIANSGPLTINIAQQNGSGTGLDVDFDCWGPFSTQTAGCSAIQAGTATSVSCSYSIAAQETCTIPSAVAGQFYVLLITNYSNQTGTISFSQTGGTGSTNCNVLCNMTALTAVPGACAPATNNYSVTGQITFVYPPSSGTLTVTSSCGGSVTIPSPWTSPITYTIPNLTSNGAACSVTAAFSADATCQLTKTYTAPASCATCTETAGSNSPVCVGSALNLTATTVSGATGYSWSGPNSFTSTSQNPSIASPTTAAAGTYTVTATTPTSTCTSTVTVTVNPKPVITAPANISVCAGATVGAQTFTSTPAGATIAWTNSNTAVGLGASGATATIPSFTATNSTSSPITSTVTVTPTLAGCTGTPVTYTITVNPQPTSTYTQSANQCLSGNSFTFTNTGVNVGTESWVFTGGTPGTGSTGTVTGVTYPSAGTYNVSHTVTASGGCTSMTTSTVTVYPAPTAVSSTTTPATCGSSNGSITISGATGGTSPYTYSVNGGAFSGTLTYSGQAAGSHPVVVQDANGCQFSTTVNVGTSSGPTALATSTVNSTCGNSNGTVNIGATTGGASPFTYSFNGSPYTSTTSYTGQAAGTYSVIVKDANGCTFTTSATVANTPGPTALATTAVNSTCGNSNGAVNIGTVTGGTAPYTYSFNASAFTATTSYTGQAAGTYSVIVKDANGCMFTTSATVANTPGPTAQATSITNASCGASNGTISIGTTTGGTSPYTFSVNASAFTATTSYTGFAAGTYNVVVKDANGCTFSTSVTITNASGPAALAVTSTNSTCGNSNGTATIGATTGGLAPYTYSYNAGAFSSTTSYTGQAAGTYSVIVKDANGCTFTTSVTINNTAGPTALATTTVNTTCGASNGTINIGTTTGGTSPYTYSVNASAFTATTTYGSLAAGTYTVVVKDANGCTFSTTATITNASGPTALATTTVNSTCGNSNGTINIGATTGGTSPYTYSVNVSAFTGTTSYGSLAAGTYTVVVKDASGCTFSTTATISNTAGPTNLATTTANSTCGNSNGTVNIGATTGGTATYVYSFNAGTFSATTAYTGLAAGTYTVTVKDANGCTFTVNPAVANTPGPTAVATTFTNPTCGNANGTITIGTVTGGTSAYTYSFNASAFTATTAYTGLTAGTYTVTVQDANGCTFTTTRTITNIAGPTAVATTTANATCGASNGSITITGGTGGTSPYTYSVNGGPFSTTTSYPGLAANSYAVVIKDANGCTFSTNATISNSGGPTALVVNTTNAACGASNGAITLGTVTGGVAPYTYSVNASAYTTTTSYTGFAAGTYNVSVKDANGCSYNTTAVVNPTTGPTALAVTTGNSTCGNSNGTISIGTVTGGTAAYTYSVNAGAFTATTNYTGFAAGTYNVIVKDANGCTFTTTASIANTPGPTAIATMITNTTCGNSNGSVVLGTVTGGTSSFTYSFNGSPFTTTTTYNTLAAGTYAIVVKDANGCTFTTNAVLTNTPGPTALATTATNSTCGNSNGVITIGATTGGTPTYVYSFNAGGFTSTTSYTGLAAGPYTIIVQDANGCTFTTSKTVANTPGPTALATSTTNSSCGASNGTATIGTTTGGTAPYTYSFNGGAFGSTTSFTGLAANTYAVVVKDANGCTFTTSAVVNNSSGPAALAVTHADATCGNSNGTVTIGATTGGTSPYSYSFNSGAFASTTSYTGLATGTYNVVVKDANGCTFSTTTTISNIAGPGALAVTSTNTTCGNANGTLTIGTTTGGTTPYTYSVNAGTFSATTSYTSLAAGTYSVVVKDANGCTFTTTATISNIPGPTAIATTITNTTCGNSNGAVALGTVTGGTSTYTYSFNGSPFTTTTTYSTLAAGTYSIVVKDANGCTYTTSVSITNTPGPTALATSTVNSTCGNSNGTVNIGLTTGGTAAYTYSFNAGGFTSTTSYPGLAAGTYAVIVKDANGCTFTTSAVVSNTAGPTALATTVTNSTCSAANGAITIGTTTGGTAPYTYSVNSSAFTSTTSYTGLLANTYSIVVKDANGCTFTTSATINDLSGLTASITAQTNVSCNAGTNGSVTVTAGGSTAPYSYSFNSGAFGASGTFGSLTAGTYTVTAKDGNGCTFPVTVTITEPTVLTGAIASQTNVSCYGGNSGAVTVSASGGTTPSYSYSIDGGAFGSSATFTNLTAGSHPVTVKDGNGCTVTIPVSITQPTALTLVTSSTNAICTAANGSASVVASGGNPLYTYMWLPGSQTTATASNIIANNYSVLVTDANGCTQTANVTVGSSPGGTAVISSSSNVTCTGANNGSATVSMGAGATPPFTYAWTPSSQTTVTATNLGPASYTVTVTDGNGCIATASTLITQPTVINTAFANTNVSCNTGNNGTSQVTATGGTGPYLYMWNPGGQSTQTATNLAANTYTCTVTDANGCTKTATTTITQPTGMTLTASHTDANCSQSNGSASVSVAGGTGPYTYSWSTTPAQTTPGVSSLAANTYVVTVTDANGCTQTQSVTINNLAGPTASIFATNNVSCNGGNNGSATVVISGGTSPYSFSWSNGQTLPTATNLTAGTYTLTTTDATGCVVTIPAVITEPAALATTYTFTNPHCNGYTDGTINTNTTGGTTAYSYSWTPGGYTTQNVTGLAAASYTVLVTDAHGCSLQTNVILTNPAAVTATTSTTNVSCNGLCNGAAVATPATGTGPFTYHWNDINAQTTQTATGLCAGNYTVTVTDANGCSATTPASITAPASINASVVSYTNVNCYNACDGTAQASATGGSAPYSFMWMPGGTSGASVNNLCANTYTVTVTDAHGCSATATVTITQPNQLNASITNTNVSCYNACDAQATAVYTGGTGPYTFLWTPSLQSTPTATNLCAGVHSLTITDAHGCTASASVAITQPTILAVNTTTTNSNCNTSNGSACASIVGGTPPFTYHWNDPATQATSCATSLHAGAYTITITDGHGCSTTNVANVNDINAPTVTIPTSTNVTCHGAANGSAQGAISGGIVPYTINWTPGGMSTAFVNNLAGGIFSMVVTDSAGCVGSASVTINEPSALVSSIISTSNISCHLSCDGTATVMGGGGTAPYTYLWNDVGTQTTSTATNLCAQSYTVTVSDANGCTSTSTTTLTEPAALTVSLVSSVNVTCNGGSDGQISVAVTGGTSGYTYTWSPSVGAGPVVTNLPAGTYNVTVTDAHGCSKTATFEITQPNALTLTPSTVAATCGNSNGSATVAVTGGISPYGYLWTPGSVTTQTITGVSSGIYNVTVTDNHGCTATSSATISNTPGPVVSSITFTEPLCHGTPTGTATAIPGSGTPSYTYAWSGPGSQITQTATALPVGTYTVTVSDANHCSVQGVVTLTEPAITQVIASPTDTICIGQLSQIYAAGYGGTAPYTYTWIPSAVTGSGPTTVNPVSSTTYTVTTTDANGCVSAQQTATVFVNPQIYVTASDTTACEGSPVNIHANATGGTGGPYTYTWSNGATGASQSVSPTVGASPVHYIVTVNDGCSIATTDTSTVIVNPSAVAFMTAPDTAGCANFTASFVGLSNIGVLYTWHFGDGSTATGANATHTYGAAGPYDVTLSVTTAQGCVSSITTVDMIDVYPKPHAGFTSNQPGSATTPLITFTDHSSGATHWHWDFEYTTPPNLLYTDTMQNTQFSYPDTGTYIVQQVVTNSFGCTDTAYNSVDIVPEYVLYAPNAFTPGNHDGLNDEFMPKGVGIDPNNFEMEIFDRWGNLIFKTNDVNKGWDGHANGGSKIAQIDTYVWKINTKNMRGEDHSYMGHVSIVK